MASPEPSREVVFAPRDVSVADASRAVRQGQARRLGPGLYTWDLHTPDSELITTRRWAILAGYAPECVVTDRSAQLLRPVEHTDGGAVLFVAHPERSRTITLPGLRIVPRVGPGPVTGDTPFMVPGIHLASPARALIDNAASGRTATDRRAGRPPRTLSHGELAAWIAELLDRSSSGAVQSLRDDVARVAADLDAADQGAVVLSMIDERAKTR